MLRTAFGPLGLTSAKMAKQAPTNATGDEWLRWLRWLGSMVVRVVGVVGVRMWGESESQLRAAGKTKQHSFLPPVAATGIIPAPNIF